MKKLLAFTIIIGLTLSLASCSFSSTQKLDDPRTTATTEAPKFGYNCPGDYLIVKQITDDEHEYWQEIIDAVNEYRNSRDFERDDQRTRAKEVTELLTTFEDSYIVSGSVMADDNSVMGRLKDGNSFTIGLREPEWYEERH